MHHIGDPTSSVALLPSRNYLDSYRTSSAATTTMQPTTTMTTSTMMTTMGGTTGGKMGMGMGGTMTMTMDSASAITATAATSGAMMTAVQSTSLQPQLPTAAAKGNSNQQHQQQLLQSSGVKSQQQQQNEPVAGAVGSHNPSHEDPPPSMSYILRTQLDELKRLPQPLGSNLLSNNELDVCKKHNITPTTYLSLKTVCLSGAPSLGSPMEISLRKFFIKCGWLSH